MVHADMVGQSDYYGVAMASFSSFFFTLLHGVSKESLKTETKISFPSSAF